MARSHQAGNFGKVKEPDAVGMRKQELGKRLPTARRKWFAVGENMLFLLSRPLAGQWEKKFELSGVSMKLQRKDASGLKLLN